jgi:hypothetical protein
MKIEDPLIAPFFIECEDKCFILKERGEKKTGNNIGEKTEDIVGYFVDFGVTLNRIANLLTIRKDITVSIQQYITTYKEIQDALLHIITRPPTIQE